METSEELQISASENSTLALEVNAVVECWLTRIVKDQAVNAKSKLKIRTVMLTGKTDFSAACVVALVANLVVNTSRALVTELLYMVKWRLNA